MQDVGDVLEGGDDRAAIHLRRLVKGRIGGALLVQEGAGVEDRLRRGSDHGPKGSAGVSNNWSIWLRQRRHWG